MMHNILAIGFLVILGTIAALTKENWKDK